MKVKHVAKVAVITAGNEVLLLKRSQTDTRRPGEWDFPGGEAEDGETPQQAAVRELQEEAGIRVTTDQLTLLYTGSEFYEPRLTNVHRYLYMVKVDAQQAVMLSFEHDSAQWVSVAQALVDFPHPFYATGLQHGLDHGLLA